MTTSPRSASSASPGHWKITEGVSALDVPGSTLPEPLLRVVPTRFGVQAVLALVGELDTSNTHIVRETVDQCLSGKPGALFLDLGGLTYCGATGARSLRWALRRAEADNVEFHLVAPPPWLRRVLTAIDANDLLAATSDPT